MVLVRKYPCFCEYCLVTDFEACINSAYVGSFAQSILRKKNMREPTARYHDPTPYVPVQQVAVEILACRLFEGRYQYQIEWEGASDLPTWHDADRLSCIELMENFEMRKE